MGAQASDKNTALYIFIYKTRKTWYNTINKITSEKHFN